jgi:hypothetical protein
MLEEISWSLPLRRCFKATVKLAVNCALCLLRIANKWKLTPADQRISGTVLVLQCHRSGPARTCLPNRSILCGTVEQNISDARLPRCSTPTYSPSSPAMANWSQEKHYRRREFSFSDDHKSELQVWLSRKLEEMLPESVAGQFRQLGARVDTSGRATKA